MSSGDVASGGRGSPVSDLAGEVRQVLAERQNARFALERAVAAVPDPDLHGSLQEVVEALPTAVSVDFATVRVADDEGRLHLVAAAGCPAYEIRTRAMEPLPLRVVEEMLVSGALHAHAAGLGVRWLHVEWIGVPRRPTGTVLVGSRTERRPTAEQLEFVREVARELERRLVNVDRSSDVVSLAAMRLARSYEPDQPVAPADTEIARLREREREILELYADGLSTKEISRLLVLSPHTIRTHVKLALRRLGLHNRDEAARRVRVAQLLQLL